MKVWIVTAVWGNRSDIESGDTNTSIVKILKYEPSYQEAKQLVLEFGHECQGGKKVCDEDRVGDPEYTCVVCDKKKEPEGMHDNDEFGDDDLFGFVCKVVESEID